VRTPIVNYADLDLTAKRSKPRCKGRLKAPFAKVSCGKLMTSKNLVRCAGSRRSCMDQSECLGPARAV